MTFIYQGPLLPNSSLFRGRTVEMRRLLDLCRTPVRAYAIVYGGRQMGKTSLLLRLGAELSSSIRCCRVDFQSIPRATALEAFRYLAQRLERSVQLVDSQVAINDKLQKEAYFTTLHELLTASFNNEEIRTLCFELGVVYDDLGGEGRSDKIRELVLYMSRLNRLDALVEVAIKQRPSVTWPTVEAGRLTTQPMSYNNIRNAPDLIDFFCQTIRRLGTEHLVLLLEELGALPKNVQDDLANVLRAMFTNRYDPTNVGLDKLMIVIAGSVELYDLAATQVSTLHNICESVYLTDLDEHETISLIIDGFSNLRWPKSTKETIGQIIYFYTGGHPYLVQRLGSLIEEALKDADSLSIEDQVDTLIEKFLHDDSLLRHLRMALTEQGLFEAGQALLEGNLRFSRLDEEMSRLELLSLAKGVNGYWHVRNKVFAKALNNWLVNGDNNNHPSLVQQRWQDLSDNVSKDLELLKAYEDAIRYEDDPKKKLRYQHEIEQLRISVFNYQKAYNALQQQSQVATVITDSNLEIQLKEMQIKLDRLRAGQIEIRQDIREGHSQITEQFNSIVKLTVEEQTVMASIVNRLDEQQLLETRVVVNEIAGDQVSIEEFQDLWQAVQATLLEVRRLKVFFSDLALKQEIEQVTEWVDAPQMEAKHKLLVTIPIIPYLLSYEGELELRSGMNLEAAWKNLVTKVLRREHHMR